MNFIALLFSKNFEESRKREISKVGAETVLKLVAVVILRRDRGWYKRGGWYECRGHLGWLRGNKQTFKEIISKSIS